MLNIKPRQGAAGLLFALLLSGPVAASPASHDEMLRQLIHTAAEGRVAYETLSPGLAQAVRPQAATAQAELSALGPLKAVTLQSRDPDGMEYYRTVFEKGALEWAFHVDDQGRIDNAIYRPARAEPR